MRGERGQAAVELVAVAPLLVLAALIAAQLVLAGRSQLAAERGVARGLTADAAGADPLSAARAGFGPDARVALVAGKLRVEVPLASVGGVLDALPPARASARLPSTGAAP